MSASTKIGLIDDHIALTDALAALLNREENLDVIEVAHNFQDGMHIIDANDCDVYIIDMNLGKEDSCELIKATNANGKIPIVLSAYSDISLIKRAVKSGAKSYLSKSSAAVNIKTAIDKTTEGEIFYDEIIQSSINTLLGTKSNFDTVPERGLISQLTPREKDIIRLIAQEYTSEEIAKELHLSKNTVDGYRKNLISKLGVKNSVGLVNYLSKQDEQR